MAPKKPEDKAHMTSSSEQEEESGSSEVESSDDEAVDIPVKKPEAESEAESESESESESEPTQKITPPKSSTSKLKQTEVQKKNTKTSDIEDVKKPEADSEDESESESDPEPAQKTTPPKSSASKRKATEDLEVKKKKKIKTLDIQEEDVKKEQAKKMFERLFSETDEIALLQGILDFGDPYKDMDRFVDDVKKSIAFDANRNQIVTKIQRLKKKFRNTVKNSLKRGKSEDAITFSKELDQQCFDLSRKIWGENGVLVSKSRNKVQETPKKKELVAHSPKKNQETVKVDGVTGASVELARFFKSENVSLYSLNESQLVVSWQMVEDGPRKRAVEEKLKKLKVMQGELCMQRTRLVAESAKVVFKDNASSSGM